MRAHAYPRQPTHTVRRWRRAAEALFPYPRSVRCVVVCRSGDAKQAEFHGQFVNFDPVWLYPKPKQRPHPPILLGGETDHTVRRVVEFCDGWFPRARGGWEPKSATARLRQAALAAGRNPVTLSITVFNAPADPAALVRYREAEIARVLLEVPDLCRDEVLRLLDKYAPLHPVPK